jgi:hypothetical protein
MESQQDFVYWIGLSNPWQYLARQTDCCGPWYLLRQSVGGDRQHARMAEQFYGPWTAILDFSPWRKGVLSLRNSQANLKMSFIVLKVGRLRVATWKFNNEFYKEPENLDREDLACPSGPKSKPALMPTFSPGNMTFTRVMDRNAWGRFPGILALRCLTPLRGDATSVTGH